MTDKFSVLSYAEEQRNKEQSMPDGSQTEGEDPELGAPGWYRELIDSLRTELAAPRGRTEEERQSYTMTLNRAVIGYDDDRRRILAVIQDLLAKRRLHRPPPSGLRYATLAEAVYADLAGLGVLESILLQKEGLEEIQVVGDRIYEVRGGVPRLSRHRFHSVRELERLQQNLVLFNKDALHIRKKWAEVSLPDGSRVTMTGFGYTSAPSLTIRFYTRMAAELETLAGPELQTMTPWMAELLRLLLEGCFNLVVIGPTNSGKTTLIKALIRELPDDERLVTIESRFELMLRRDCPEKNVLEYETNEDDAKHNGAQAFKLALRQSPKRIIHAEIRDSDANLYVRACTRGHDGSLTTVHASVLEDVPEAIADMCLMDDRGLDPVRLVRRIADYVTHIGLEMALVEGRRRLVRIGEYGFADGRVDLREWVRYDHGRKRWLYPMDVSDKAWARLARYSPNGTAALQRLKEAAADALDSV